MLPPHSLPTKLAAAWPPEAWQDVSVLLAVSGGADSVALLRAMRALKTGGAGGLAAAHLNHHLRAEGADADEAFVVDLCRRLDVPCEVGHARLDAAETGDGLESAARTARYEFLQETAARLGARYVVTAHTADDQAETILHRILRGTGIAGLRGMNRARPLGPAATLIRPLLQVRRTELVAYLNELGQPYRTDSTNADTQFTRNRLRHDLLPKLAAEYNPTISDALLRLGTLAGEVQGVVDRLVEQLAEQCVARANENRLEIKTPPLADQPRYVVRELLIALWRDQGWPLQAMGFAQWDLLADMALADAERSPSTIPKQTFPGNVLVEIQEERLVLARTVSQ